MSYRTITQVADAFGGDAATISYRLRQYRVLHTAGLVPAASREGRGKTATALFDEAGTCTFRLFSRLTEDFSFSTAMASGTIVSLNSSVRPGTSLPDALKGIRAGEAWSLILDILPDKRIAGHFERDGASIESDKAEEIMQSAGYPAMLLGRLVIPCSDLLKPLLV